MQVGSSCCRQVQNDRRLLYIYYNNPTERIIPCNRDKGEDEDERDSPGRPGGWESSSRLEVLYYLLWQLLWISCRIAHPTHTSTYTQTHTRILRLLGWYGIQGAGNSVAKQEQAKSKSRRGCIRGGDHLDSMLLVAACVHIRLLCEAGRRPSLSGF
jgi:hypothetical protein